MMSEDMLPTRGLSVLEDAQGTGPPPDIALYIDLRCVCVYEALPATFSQSTQQLWRASKTPVDTQQWSEQTQDRNCAQMEALVRGCDKSPQMPY